MSKVLKTYKAKLMSMQCVVDRHLKFQNDNVTLLHNVSGNNLQNNGWQPRIRELIVSSLIVH